MSKKSIKVLSHAERMNNIECKPQPIIPTKNSINAIESYVDKSTGKVLKRSVKKTIDPVTEMAKYKVSDFCLENLNAAGVDLRICSLNGSVFNSVDNMTSTLNQLDNIKISE